ncbi:acyltransferase family protein [Acinetobacter soli]|uniref:acyltransferase family protein n=1 Tax=Acinetobacter soli TaxID=487316 RepID=UPI001250642A|nr:acyltransferase [Acinetobacter soli]
MQHSSKLNAVESIRGLACLAVVFSHLSLSFYPYLHHFDDHDQATNALVYWIHHSPFTFWYSGTAAVYVFFVLSGFILSYVIGNSRAPKQKIKSMLIKRYPRLAIPALISCILLWAALYFSDIDSSQVQYWLQVLAQQNSSFGQAIYEGTIGSFLFAESSVNWVLWTMQVELIGSVVLFALLYLKQYSSGLFLTLVLMFPLSFALFKNMDLYLGLISFLLGSLIFFYGRRIASNAWAGLLLALGLYLAGAHNSSLAYQGIYQFLGDKTYDYCNFLSGSLIVYSILMSPLLSRMLDRPVFVYLGKLSFSVYLLHLMLLYIVCLPVFNYCVQHGFNYDSAFMVASLFFLVAILICSDIYSRVVDRFAIFISNKLAQYWVGA